MSYTIDTIANSNIVIDDEYERRSLADQGWEMTDRPVIQSPINGATGVSQEPIFQWAEYVKDIPIENLVYKLEVVAIASAGTTPDWTNAFSLVTDQTSANLREVLDPAQFYAWRVLALSRTLPNEFIDTFERASLGVDYENSTPQGTGSSSIVSDDLVIEADATSATARQITKLLKNFENPTIYFRNVRFGNVTADSQTTFYFNTEGDFVNNQQNGYYLFPFDNTIRVGKVVDNSPSDKQIKDFTITANQGYDFKIDVVNSHVKITAFDHGSTEPAPQIDWTDPDSSYLSGGISFSKFCQNGVLDDVKIGSIEVIFSEGEVTDITGVTISGSTSDLEEGQTRQFSASVEGTGSVQQSVNWEVTGGTFAVVDDVTMDFTAAAGAGACSVTAKSTQDETVIDTVNFNRVEESAPSLTDDSTQGDIEALQDLYASSQGEGIPTVASENDLPDPNTAEYPYQYIINGDIYTLYNRYNNDPLEWVNDGTIWKDSTGWSTNNMDLNNPIYGVEVDANNRVVSVDLRHNGLCGNIDNPSFGNLKKMKYFNVHYNFLTGHIPALNDLVESTHLYFNFPSGSPHIKEAPHGEGSQPDEIRDGGIFDENGNPTTGGEIHPGKNERDRTSTSTPGTNGWNDFNGVFPEVSNLQNLEYLSANWLPNLEGFHDSVFHLSSAIYIGLFEINSPKREAPSTSNLPNIEQFHIGRAEPRNKVDAWMQGNYPTIITNWTSLRYNNMTDQLLSGDIPNLGNLSDLRGLGLGGNAVSGPFPAWLMDGSVPLLSSVSFDWPSNNSSFEGTVPKKTGGASFDIFRFADHHQLTGHIYANSIGGSNFHFDIRRCNFTTIDYDITNLGRGWSTRYFACPHNPNLQVSGGTGLPLLPLDSKEWRSAGFDLRNCSFQGTITQEAIDAIVYNIENHLLRNIYIQGNKFTQAELQPLIDAVNATGITMDKFYYGNQKV